MKVTWDEVRVMAEQTFNIWVDHPELRWVERAWTYLEEGRLTTADATLDRLLVYIRLFVLASLYRDWCAIVWDEVHDDSPGMWFSNLEDVAPVHVGQLIGPDVDLAEDADDALNEALNSLIERERHAVVRTLREGFGGTAELFIALWQSRDNADETADDDDRRTDRETEEDILNQPTREKMTAYAWICDGCPTRGPIRSTADMDDWTG